MALCRRERLSIVRGEVGSGPAPSDKASRVSETNEVELRKTESRLRLKMRAGFSNGAVIGAKLLANAEPKANEN